MNSNDIDTVDKYNDVCADSNLLTGVKGALPIVLGYLPIGFAFGVHSAELVQHPTSRAHIFALNATAHLGWVVGTLLGAVLGGGDDKPGIDQPAVLGFDR